MNLKTFRTFRVGAENATENGVKVSFTGGKNKLMYCKYCKKHLTPVILVRTRDKPLNALLQYSSVNQLCPECYAPMLPMLTKKGKRGRVVDVSNGWVDKRKIRKGSGIRMDHCYKCKGFLPLHPNAGQLRNVGNEGGGCLHIVCKRCDALNPYIPDDYFD